MQIRMRSLFQVKLIKQEVTETNAIIYRFLDFLITTATTTVHRVQRTLEENVNI